MLHLLCYVAETERENIRQRQAEGIEAAKKRGVQLGRHPLEVPEEFEGIYEKWKRGDISGRKAADELGVAYQTFKKWIKSRDGAD